MLEGDLNESLMVMRIVSFNGSPFAYAQDYSVGTWPQVQFLSSAGPERARRAYAKAGLVEDRSADTRRDGVSVMLFRR